MIYLFTFSYEISFNRNTLKKNINMSTDSTNELEKSLNNKLALIKPKKLVLSDEKPLADLAKMPSSETSDTELLYVSEEAVFAQRYKDLMGGLKSTENDKLVEISETISGLQKEVFSSKELTQNTFDFTTKNLPLKKVYQQPYNSTTEGTSMTDVFEKLREKTYQTEWNGKIPVNTETKDRVEFSLFTNDESNLGVISPYVKCLSDPDGDPELLKASSKELLKQLVPFMCKENGLFFTLVHGGLKSFQEGEDLIKPTNFNVMYHVFSAFGDLPLPYISNAVIDILIKAEIPPELDEISTSSLDATTDEFLEKTKIIQEETINKIDKTEKETHESVES